MAKLTGGPLVPGDDFLKRVLSAEPDKIADRLKEVHQKLESRFAPELRNLVAAEEQALAKVWDTFKAQFDLQDLFNTRVVFKNAGDTHAFEKLVQFSDRLILLDQELKGCLHDIVSHKKVDANFPDTPTWLKVGRALLSLEAETTEQIHLYLDSKEVRALVEDHQRVEDAQAARSSSAQQSGKQRPVSRFKTEPRPQTGGIEDVGFVWNYFDTGSPNYNLGRGWEPKLESSRYRNSSIFRTSEIGLRQAVIIIQKDISADNKRLEELSSETSQNIREAEALRIEIKRNKSKVQRLKDLIEVFDKPLHRQKLLRRWKREFPPPQDK